MDACTSQNYKDTIAPFSLEGLSMHCKCVKVYDGDTITVVGAHPLIFGGEPRIYKIRIAGIDTPEIRGAKSQKERRFAYIVRNHLRRLLLDKWVVVDFHDFGKWGGRTLGSVTVLIDDDEQEGENGRVRMECVAEHLIERGYAYEYDGGTKQTWFPCEADREQLARNIIMYGVDYPEDDDGHTMQRAIDIVNEEGGIELTEDESEDENELDKEMEKHFCWKTIGW